MLQTNDIGKLFSIMKANYGHRWPHAADAIPVWQQKLGSASAQDVMAAASKAIDHYVDFPPSIGQFVALIRETTPRLPSANDNMVTADRAYAYARAQSKTNPQGNPHHVNLPESVASRQPGESADAYMHRISAEVTHAMYPGLRR